MRRLEEMKIAHLAIGDRSFYFSPDDADQVLAAAAVARDRGEWFDLIDAAGNHVRLLIPSQVLLVYREFEADDSDRQLDPNDWASFDYDL